MENDNYLDYSPVEPISQIDYSKKQKRRLKKLLIALVLFASSTALSLAYKIIYIGELDRGEDNVTLINKNIFSQEQEIIFEEMGSVYIYNFKTSQKTKLPSDFTDSIEEDTYNGFDFFDLSLNKNYLYIFVSDDIYIYSFLDQKTKIIRDIGLNPNIEDFSPDGNYIIIDTGCCPGNRGRILITAQGDLIDKDYGQDLAWSQDNLKYILSVGNIYLDVVPLAPPPNNDSIFLKKIAGEKVITEKLLNADYQNSYRVINWVDKDSFIFMKSYYREPFPSGRSSGQFDVEEFGSYWMDIWENPKITYHVFNLSDGTIREIDPPEEEAKETSIDSSVSYDGKMQIVNKLITDKNIYEVFVSKIDGSGEIKIAESSGNSAIWK